jgi:crossover junction endodeoxyribonuclease RusA
MSSGYVVAGGAGGGEFVGGAGGAGGNGGISLEPFPGAAALVAGLCDWVRDADGVQTEETHEAFHYGSPCPYAVCAAALRGQPDPRELIAIWRLDLSIILTRTGAPPLSLNDRGMHWAAKAKAIERVKAQTRNAVRTAEIPQLGHVHVKLRYRPRDRRPRDADNIVATLKPCIDALHQLDPLDESWCPIVAGDTAAHVSWEPPVLMLPAKGQPAALWLVLSSTG